MGMMFFFFFQAEDGIRDLIVTGVQTCALPILALIGVRPVWEGASGRVTGFEILPASVLDRPRVDVTLRISGFFRDAFPGLIDLFDSAVRAVAALDEPAATNPLAARYAADCAALAAEGVAPEEAARRG